MGIEQSKNTNLRNVNSTQNVTMIRDQTKHTDNYTFKQRNGKCPKDTWKYKLSNNDVAYCDKPNPRVCYNANESLPEDLYKQKLLTLDKQHLLNYKFHDTTSCTYRKDHRDDNGQNGQYGQYGQNYNDDRCAIECTYNVNSINTEKEMKAFQNIWKDSWKKDKENKKPYDQDNEDGYFNVLNNYCSQIQENNCVDDPNTGAPMEKCSRKFTVGESICSEWYETLDKNRRNAFISNICNKDKNLRECKCIFRTKEPSYNVVSTLLPVKDECWWKPCQDSSVNLIPYEMVNSECPSNICQTIIKVNKAGHDVKINDITNNITCSPDTNPDKKPDTKPDIKPDSNPDTKPDSNPDSNTDSIKSFISSNKSIIMIFILILIILLIFMYVVFLYNRNKNIEN